MLLLAASAVAASAPVGTAMAAFTPQLSASHGTMGLSRSATSSIRVTVPRNDDALFKATIYAPRGYIYNLTQSAGTQVGTVTAQVRVSDPFDAVIPITGTIVTANPADNTTSPCAPGLHGAVWILVLQAAGQELRVPVYVDQAAGAETAFASLRLQVCLPSPHIPPSLGGATFGAKLIQAQLNINSVQAPTTAGTYVWRALFTPWQAPATPNIAATTEARGDIKFPARLTLSLRVTNKSKRTVRWSGRLTEDGDPVAGARITIVRSSPRVRATATTNAGGSFGGTIRLRRPGTVVLQVRATVPERPQSGCTGTSPLPAPAGCASETLAFYVVTSNTARLRVR